MNQEINNQNKSKKKKIIYIVIVIILLALSFAAGFFLGHKKLDNNATKCITETLDKNNDKEKDNKEDDYDDKRYTYNLFDTSKITKVADTSSDLSKNIEIYDLYLNPDAFSGFRNLRNVYVYGKNKNSQIVYVETIFEYYDKDGYRIDKQTANSVVYGNSEFVLSGYILDDDNNYASVKMTYKATKIKSYYVEIPSNQLETSVTRLSEGTITLRIKNNYLGTESKDAYIFMNTACLYYKDGKIVHAINGAGGTGIHKGETGEIRFHDSQLDDHDYKQVIEYDDYKAFVYGAYYADDTNY